MGTPTHTMDHGEAACLREASLDYGRLRALDRIDLAVTRGEVLALLGPNGAGKSSAIALLTGRLRPTTGRARVFGHDPCEASVRRRMGVMLQSAGLPEMLKVGELVRQFSAYYPAPRALHDTLVLAGLEGLQGRRYEALSGGQQRRVQFALAICGRPPLLFVDEPSTGLDSDARRLLWTAVGAMRDEGTAVVLTTHYLEEADALADRIMLINQGRVVAQGTPQAIKLRAAGRRIRCRTTVDADVVASWPGVDSVAHVPAQTGVLEIACCAAEEVLRRLLALDSGLSSLEVGSGSLEQAVLSLTRGDPESGQEREAA